MKPLDNNIGDNAILLYDNKICSQIISKCLCHPQLFIYFCLFRHKYTNIIDVTSGKECEFGQQSQQHDIPEIRGGFLFQVVQLYRLRKVDFDKVSCLFSTYCLDYYLHFRKRCKGTEHFDPHLQSTIIDKLSWNDASEEYN